MPHVPALDEDVNWTVVAFAWSWQNLLHPLARDAHSPLFGGLVANLVGCWSIYEPAQNGPRDRRIAPAGSVRRIDDEPLAGRASAIAPSNAGIVAESPKQSLMRITRSPPCSAVVTGAGARELGVAGNDGSAVFQ